MRRVAPSQIATVLLVTGFLFLFVGLYFNWVRLLASVGFPARELSNPWILADLGVVRGVCVLLGGLLVLSRIALWRYPQAVATSVEAVSSLGSPHPLLVPLTLTVLILAKTVLQLVLYMLGYSAFSADDFGRPLSAAFWLRYHKFDLGMDGWLGLAGSGWLPFSDFLFAAALAIHQDLFITPRVVNVVLSGLVVASVYLLGSELFGRTVGLVTAALFTFQPWPVWLGMSGMGSDLPSVGLISLFGAFLVRWLRTDKPSALVKAAGFLALANGFRYENWLFALAFSILLVCLAFSRWRRHHLTGRWVAASGSALLLANVLPVGWMTANYVVFGDWLPAMHGINAFMVSVTASQTPLTETKMGIPLMAVGAFPFELALSLAGIALFPDSYKPRPLRLYLLVLAVAALLFALLFRGQLAAWLSIARSLLGFVVLALPYAGYLLARLLRTRQPWRDEGIVAACLILMTVAAFDVGRVLNYPAGVPRDAVRTGWTVRSLQDTRTISADAKILIERSQDFGDLSIVALANRPERFVVLNELAYRQTALSGQLANRPAMLPELEGQGVRGTVCRDDFQDPACTDSVLREKFDFAILSSPRRVASFQDTFHARSWNIGRYHVFDMRSAPLSSQPTARDRATQSRLD